MKLLFITIQILSGAVIVVVGLEILLRIYPAAIPLKFLMYFDEDLRVHIAQRLDLPNRYDFLEVPRDDGGPLLRRRRPGAEFRHVGRDRGHGISETMVYDELGFCNSVERGDITKQASIVAIGDSFTDCLVPPDQVWPGQLEAFSGRPTYNLGLAGVGPYEYIQLLKQFGLQRRPQIVIMDIYEGNDLRDALRYWDHRNNKGGEARVGKLGPVYESMVLSHSYAANIAMAAWHELIYATWRSLTEVEPEFKESLDSIDKDSLDFRYVLHLESGELPFNTENADRDELRLAKVLDQGLIDLGVFDDALAAFTQLAKDNNFLPVVIYSPSAHTAYGKYAVFPDPSTGPVLLRYSQRLRKFFRDASDRFGFRFLDLTQDLQEEIDAQGSAQEERLLYFPYNVHYTSEGNRVVARAVARFIDTLP